MNDKNRLSLFGMYLLVGLFIMLTIVTCAGIWNLVSEPFIIVSSILMFICNGFVARYFIKLINKWDQDTKE